VFCDSSAILGIVPLLASKWDYLLNGVNCPVTLVHGKLDPAYAFSTIERFVQNKPNFRIVPSEDAGQLVLYRDQEIAFSALDEQFVGQRVEALVG